jgi:ParB family transcriptional regulator, chromosome partitioning protein
MASGDDAAALEVSPTRNIARLDPGDIALTFGLTGIQVKRTLALGNLLPRIRTLYQAGEIDGVTVRHLTLASKTRQRDWLAMVARASTSLSMMLRLRSA